MKLSSRGRHGIRALLDVALQWSSGPVQLKDIARRHPKATDSASIPGALDHPSYSSGNSAEHSGARAGLSLAKPPQEIKLSEAPQPFEGSISLVDCVDNPESCPRPCFCVTRDIWVNVKKAMVEVLEFTTLQDLVEQQGKEGTGNRKQDN